MNLAENISSFFNEEVKTSKEFLCGVEFEIECVKVFHHEIHGAVNPTAFSSEVVSWEKNGPFGCIIDNSLRNNGLEIVTKPSTISKTMEYYHKLLTSKINFYSGNKFSSRTSTHVHVNVAPWTEEQAKVFVLLYALFEPYFYSKVNSSRKNNIHCVPLNYTALPAIYNKSLDFLVNKWSKYTALNLAPLWKQGTIEFRHLEGADSAEKLHTWLFTIKCLWDAVNELKPDFSLEHCIKNGSISLLFKSIFKQDIPPGMDFSSTLIDVKLALI